MSTNTPLSWLDGLAKGYAEVADESAALPQRARVRFLGPVVTVEDNETEESTDITIDASSIVVESNTWDPVLAVAVLNVPLGAIVASVDGETIPLDGRVGLVNQSNKSENGLYVKLANGHLERAADADSSDVFVTGKSFSVKGGKTYMGATFVLYTASPIALDSDELRFVKDQPSLDMRAFGVVADGETDDGPALRLVRDAAKALGGAEMVAPPGLIKIASSETYGGAVAGVVFDFDDAHVVGAGLGRTTFILDFATPGDAFIPMVFQKRGESDVEPQLLKNVSLRKATLKWLNSAPNDPSGSSTVQFNRCLNPVAECEVIGNGTGQNGGICDGVVFAMGCINPRFSVVGQGMSKPAVYIPLAYNAIGECWVSDGKNTSLNPIPGLALAGCYGGDITVHAYGNDGPGIDIGGQTYQVAGTIASVTSQTEFSFTVASPIGTVLANLLHLARTANGSAHTTEELEIDTVETSDDGTTWDVVLKRAPTATLAVAAGENGKVYCGAVSPHNVTLRGSSHHNGQEGLVFADAGGSGVVSRAVTLDLDVHHNGLSGTYYGINAVGYDGLSILGDTHDNPAGIVLQDIGGQDTSGHVGVQDRARNAVIGGRIRDNLLAQLTIKSATGVQVSKDAEISRQSSGTGYATPLLFDRADVLGNGNRANAAIVIGAFARGGYTGQLMGAAVSSGDYPDDALSDFDLQHDAGSPEGASHGVAPKGSRLVDSTNGYLWIKSTSATLTTGWVRAHTTDDSAEAATASKLVQRDASARGLFSTVNLSGLTASQAVVTDASKYLTSLSYTAAAVASTIVSRDSNADAAFRVASASLQVTTIKVASASALTCEVASGNNFFVSVNGTNALAFGAATAIWNLPNHAFTETQAPLYSIDQRTSDAAVHDWTFQAQAPFAAATGTNRNGGGFTFIAGLEVAGGAAGFLAYRYNGVDYFRMQGAGWAFNNQTPTATDTVTGSRGGNAALADLLTKLAAKGIVIDGTSA
jgi:hypothetical protein